jgi:hypothetical protein
MSAPTEAARPGQARRREVALGFTPERACEGTHICYLYGDDAERLQVTARFLESGLAEGERVLHLTDTLTVEQATSRLAGLGLDLGRLGTDLVVGDATLANCPSGRFVPSTMLAALRDFYAGARAEGYAGARGTGEMTWTLAGGRYDLDELMDYEAQLNDVLRDHPFTACCQYDLRRFDGQAIMDLLAVHPVTLVRGQLVVNPYYVEPAAFLARQHRRAAPHA